MSDHLPEVPRYRVHAENLHRWAGVPPRDLDQAGYREVVLHADHAAALAAQATAHEAARRAAYRLGYEAAKRRYKAAHEAALTEAVEAGRSNSHAHYMDGVRDEKARIRAGVEALRPDEPWGGPTTTTGSFYIRKAAVLMVIDGEDK